MTVDADVLLDTNILIYAAQGAKAEPEKHGRARQIVADENYATSTQVLAEFYANVVKKGRVPLDPKQASQWVRVLAKKPCQDVDTALVQAGIEISQRYRISYWDGAIIAAAERLGCKTLYTEDLNHGQTYGSVTAINPFFDATIKAPS